MSLTTFGPWVLGRRQDMQLTMQNLLLTGQILPVGASLWVRHEFRSNEPQPVEVVYAFALPREATLRRFRISGDEFDVASELRSRQEARKEYEDGIAQRSLSNLATIYRDGVTNLSVGNIRANEKVVVLLEILAGVELRRHYGFCRAHKSSAILRAGFYRPPIRRRSESFRGSSAG